MSRPAILDLERQYEEECYFGDDRAAAEYAYAIAIRLREDGRPCDAQRYAAACLRHAQSLPSRSLDDVTTARIALGGIPMPERFHDGVVRFRLAALLPAA
jgi:hypothetical protein